jgi:hypothetical protein
MIDSGGGPVPTRQYAKNATDTHAIYAGDLLAPVLGGAPSETGVGNLVPTVETGYQGTPGTTLWAGVSINYGAASTLSYHTVVDDREALFDLQADSTVIATGTHIQLNANVNIGTLPAAGVKQSAMYLNGATIAATATLDLRLMKVSDIIPNAEGAYAVIEVVINKHIQNKGVTPV